MLNPVYKAFDFIGQVCPNVYAIAKLTVKAAVRSRMLVIFLILLGATVGLLPILIKHDGTAAMFTQVMITYTMVVLTTLLMGATIWMACGAISREVSDCSLQILTTKPISRREIWFGKLLGLSMINSTFLVVVGLIIYLALWWGAGRLPEAQQALLNEKLMVARGALTETPTDRTESVERILNKRLNEEGVQDLDPRMVRKAIEDQFQMADELVPGNSRRRWDIDLGWRKDVLKDQPMFIRVKMQSADIDFDNPVYKVKWVIGDFESGKYREFNVDMIHNSFRELKIPPNMWDDDGRLRVEVWNYSRATLRFPLTEPLEVLFPEGSFEANFGRALLVIFFWLIAVAAVGLAASSYLTLPVASFMTLTVLIVFMSGNLLETIVQERTIGEITEEGELTTKAIDPLVVPIFEGVHKLVTMSQGVAPISRLSIGRSILLEEVIWAFAKKVIVIGGLMSLIGIFLFNRRELAAIPGNDS
ncbi:MAG: ABC transporter permease [Limisphaerales bacterium]